MRQSPGERRHTRGTLPTARTRGGAASRFYLGQRCRPVALLELREVHRPAKALNVAVDDDASDGKCTQSARLEDVKEHGRDGEDHEDRCRQLAPAIVDAG